MTDIDNLETMRALDPSGVLASIVQFPDQCQQAWQEASAIRFPSSYEPIYNIVVSGMGGSRFTPRTIKELFRDRIREPYEVIEDYTLPAYVDGDTLVILSSYSGMTAEVLSCGQEAVKRGAKLTGIVSGGSIQALLSQEHATMYVFDPRHNPSGQPRMGGGYLLMGHAGLLSSLGLLPLDTKEVDDAITFSRSVVQQCDASVPASQNPAKQLAIKLHETHPFIVTAEFLKGFGNGFANQLNETAKLISDSRVIPELNHHLMEGLGHPATLRKSALFVFLRSRFYSAAVSKRITITADVLAKQGVRTHEVSLTGPSPFSQTLEGYVLSGFTSFYLAMLYDTDPAAIPWVTYFKKQMKGD